MAREDDINAAQKLLSSIGAFFRKLGHAIKTGSIASGLFLKKAYTGKFRFLAIGITSVLFLYAVYFGFCFRPEPTYKSRDYYWTDIRNIAFHILMAVLILSLAIYGFYQAAQRKLTVKKAAILLALMGALFVSIYGLSTPIYDYNGLWNQHDLYYGSTASRYYMEDRGILDGGGGHFGMLMSVYKYTIIPEIKKVNGVYDFSFGGVLERYQPKLFYIISGFYMKFNALFIPNNEGVVMISNSAAYGLTNKDWSVYESLRLLYTMMEWLQIYFIYKIFVRLHLKGKGLLIAFGLAIFTPMWCYFANWTNNDGMSTFFAIVGLYYAICYVQDGRTYQVLMVAVGVGCSMACKLGGALIAIVIAPLLVYRFVMAIMAPKKDESSAGKKLPEWGFVALQLLAFAAIVFPLGLGFPIYNYVRFGQPIMFFSPVNNPALHIQNESFFERFVLFPNSDCFRMIWVYHSNQSPEYIQDTSLLTALVKTSLYGEYGFGLSNFQCSFLYVVTLGFIFFMMILLPYRFIRFCMAKEKKIDTMRLYVFAALIAVMYGWAVFFVATYPDTCNEDMRYIAPIILAIAGLVGSSFQSLEENETIEPIRKGGMATIGVLTGFFIFAATFAYLTMSPWYFR